MGVGLNGQTSLSAPVNWGKRAICVDARQEAGRKVLHRFVEQSDVVLESFRPGILDKIGLGFDVLQKLRPGIVLGSISGFGSAGPNASRPGSDSILQAATGMASMNQDADGKPRRVGMLAVDMIAGLYAGFALAAAISEQRQSASSPGRHLELSLLGAASAFQATPMLESFLQNGVRNRPVTVPSGNFATLDGEIAVVCLRNEMFRSLAEVLGHPEWAEDPRFADNAARQDNAEAINSLLEKIFLTQPRDHWIEKLNETGVLCGPMNSYQDLIEDPQVQYLGLLPMVNHEVLGSFPMPRMPGSQIDPRTLCAAPALGGQTRELLIEAGFDAAEINELLRNNVCIQSSGQSI